MSKGVEIDIGANTRDFQRGVKDVEKALEDVSDSLDDVSRDAAKSGEKIGDEISDGAKDGEKSLGRLERSFKEVADGSKKASKTAGDALEKNVRKGSDGASDAIKDFNNEARQNISSTFSSFRGDAEDLVQLVQDISGGIAADLGPAGLVAGAGIAAGIGLAVARGQELADAINETKERATELAAEINEAGGNLSEVFDADYVAEWGAQILDSREWFEIWQKDAVTAFELAQKGAEKTGIALTDMVDGMSGADPEQAISNLKLLREELEKLEKARITSGGSSLERNKLDAEINSYKELIDVHEKQLETTQKSIELSKLHQEANAERIAQEEAIAAATEARTDATKALQASLDDSVDSWEDFAASEEKAADPSGYIEAMQARMVATSNFNTNVQSISQQFGLTAAETQAILDQGIEFAPMLQSIIDSGMSEQYATTIRQMLSGGQAIVDGTPINSTVVAQPDTKDADAQLEKTAEDRTTDVTAKPETTTAEKKLDDIAAKKRTATIGAEIDLSAAEAALTRFISQRRVTTVTAEVRTPEGKPVP